MELSDNIDGLLSVEEACRWLGVSKPTLYAALNSKQLESVRIGRRRLIDPKDLQTYVDGLKSNRW